MGRGWNHKIKIKHLFTEDESHEAVQKSMNAVADVLDKGTFFVGFDTKKFRAIPADNEFFEPVECANKLLEKLYDFADDRRIWIA